VSGVPVPTYKRPLIWRAVRKLGSLNRTLPDYFNDQAAGGYLSIAATAAKWSFVAVYNNATQGEILQVWGVSIGGGTAAQENGMYVVQGVPTGPSSAGIPTNGSYKGLIPGQVYGKATNSNPWTVALIFGAVTGPQTWNWHGAWPICILPPTYTFLVANVNQNLNLQCGLWWISTPPLLAA